MATTTHTTLEVARTGHGTIAILFDAGGTVHSTFIAYPATFLTADVNWYLEYAPAAGKYQRIGVFQGGPVGEYPDRERAEDAMWTNLAGDLGVAAGFMNDGGG